MRRVLACLAFLAWATSASAQEPMREDGLGPYRFAMSAEEARATAPNAAWSVSREGLASNAEALSGSPRIVLAGWRFNTVLVFERDALAAIVLTTALQANCVTAVPAVVTELEATFGAFGSAPGVREVGGIINITRTTIGSEIRTRVTEDGIPSLHSSRRGRMFIAIAGQVRAGNVDACDVSIVFTEQKPQPANAAVSFEEIDRAETLANPEWVRRATAQTYARYFPRNALIESISGGADLDCLIGEDQRLRCLIAFEWPDGAEFGDAAINVARDFRVAPVAGNASTAGKRVRVAIRFNAG